MLYLSLTRIIGSRYLKLKSVTGGAFTGHLLKPTYIPSTSVYRYIVSFIFNYHTEEASQNLTYQLSTLHDRFCLFWNIWILSFYRSCFLFFLFFSWYITALGIALLLCIAQWNICLPSYCLDALKVGLEQSINVNLNGNVMASSNILWSLSNAVFHLTLQAFIIIVLESVGLLRDLKRICYLDLNFLYMWWKPTP